MALIAAAVASAIAAGARAQPVAALEAANEQLVRAFLGEASADLGHLRFLADDVTFQYEDTRIEGRQPLVDQYARKMSAASSYDVEILRLSVVGNTVLNERLDIATMKDGQQVRLNVTSVFLIEDGRIAEWREYPAPVAGP